MTNASELIRAAPSFLGTPYKKLDCQAFVEASLKKIGIDKNLAGSNTWYRYIQKNGWIGSPEECKQKFGMIPKGCFLFIRVFDGKEPEQYQNDGEGNAKHIGIYTAMSGAEMCDIAIADGNGDADRYNFGDGAIHSSQSRGFVCTSKFAGKSINGGWNRIGLWNQLSYGETIDRILSGKEQPENGNQEGGKGMTATVYAPSGSTVNLRAKPSSGSNLIDRVPVGAKVEIESESGDWAYIDWNGKKGYMMSQYLKLGEIQPGEDDTDSSMIPVERSWLESVYQKIGDLLGVKG